MPSAQKVLNHSKDHWTANTDTPTQLVSDSVTDQTTTFHDDRVVDHNMFPGHTTLPSALLKSVQEERYHDIKDFLGRPSVIDTGAITNAAVVGDLVTQLDLPVDLLSLPMYREKTRGFLNFRATVNLRFQANAQRFQQGRLFITYFPQADLNPKKFDVVQPLTLATQLPRVDFDFATDSDVALSIPYVSPTLGYNQINQTGAMGTYRVRIYSPLVSPGGPAVVDWTLWAWFTDIELDFPTWTPQGNMGRQAKKSTPSEMEARPVSTLFNKVSKAATIFTDVPLIGSFAGSLAWASGILSKTAASFGFSNPDTANTSTFSHMNLAHDVANVNAIGNSVNLGLLSDNKVRELPGFAGTDIDEMSFAYLTKIPSYIDRFSWTTSNTSGVNIFSKPLSLGSMCTVSPSGPDYIWPTPMLYIANMFKYWRTGFTFTFKFVKTEFHSGRLMVVFAPGVTSTLTFADTRFCYREILDLRESNEFTITIPYTSTLPYLSMPETDITVGDSMGILSIYVLNPLVGPSTVSPSIDVIVEVCADDTYEVAVPRNVLFPPVMYTPGTGAPTLVADDDDELVPQGLGENVQDNSKEATLMEPAPSITGIRNNDGGLTAAMHCIGEKILSLRSLSKRAAPILVPPITSVVSAFRPKIIALDNCSDNTTVPAVYGLDYISMIAPLFNYQRGGLKFLAYHTALTTGTTFMRAGLAPNTLGTTPLVSVPTADAEKVENNSLAIHLGPTIAGGLNFTIPQYSRTHCEMYRFYTAPTYPLPTDIYSSDLRVFIKTNSTSLGTKIYRQAADDWSCGFFTGCIPIRNIDRTGTVVPAM
jgi:hypothetical protein